MNKLRQGDVGVGHRSGCIRRAQAICAAVCPLLLATSASANVTIGGDAGQVLPLIPPNWNSSYTNVSIGIDAGRTGTLSVDNGSRITTGTSTIGVNANSTGTVTVTGPGSMWQNSHVYVGNSGTGSLNIDNGATVSGYSAQIGYAAGSTGSALVRGAGSAWTMDVSLIGESGTGSLNIETGGQLNTTTALLGYGLGSAGAVTVTGTGSTWTNQGDLSIGYRGAGTMTVSKGSVVNTDGLRANLDDLDGGGTINTKGLIGDTNLTFNAAHGLQQTLSFRGGGKLNLDADGTMDLGVGYKAEGTMQISGGVSVASRMGCLGYQPLSSGTATVTGTGSTWASSVLFVGHAGSGTLNIQNGGTVTSTTGCMGWYGGSSGTVKVTGAGSSWTNSGEICVGNLGNVGPPVEAAFIDLGVSGTGTLEVWDGAVVNAGSLFAAAADLRGDGIINTSGLVSDVDLVFDSAYGATQQTTVPFGAGGTINLSLSPTETLGVGVKGHGTIRIADGVIVRSAFGSVGVYAGSSGTATVTGPGSTWAMTDGLQVGRSGTAALLIENGGKVSITSYLQDMYLVGGDGSIDGPTHSASTVTVTGAGSSWTSDSLVVGCYGAGVLNVANGGTVTSRSAKIGYSNGSEGRVTVTGTGSRFSLNGHLAVGTSDTGRGIGHLLVAHGGQVKAGSLSIGNSSSSVNLHVSGDDMVVLGSAYSAGSIANGGTVNLYADPFMASGTYRPISEALGRPITWSGTGAYNAFGGVWDNANKLFTVADATPLAAGTSHTLNAGQRLIITTADGSQLGASFGNAAAGNIFAASPMGSAELSGLDPGNGQTVFAAWDFSTSLTGQTVLVSMDVGAGKSDLQAWHYSGGTWSPFAADDFVYDNGIASFTVSSFSGYAVVGMVPEPTTLFLSLAACGLLIRRRRS